MLSWTALETGSGSAEFLLLFLVYVLVFLLFYLGLPVVGVVLMAWQAPKIVFHGKGLRNRGWTLGLVFIAIGSWVLWFGISTFTVPSISTEGLVWGAAAFVEGIILFALSGAMVVNEVRARRIHVSHLNLYRGTAG